LPVLAAAAEQHRPDMVPVVVVRVV